MDTDISSVSVMPVHFYAGTAPFLISSSCGFVRSSLWLLSLFVWWPSCPSLWWPGVSKVTPSSGEALAFSFVLLSVCGWPVSLAACTMRHLFFGNTLRWTLVFLTQYELRLLISTLSLSSVLILPIWISVFQFRTVYVLRKDIIVTVSSHCFEFIGVSPQSSTFSLHSFCSAVNYILTPLLLRIY